MSWSHSNSNNNKRSIICKHRTTTKNAGTMKCSNSVGSGVCSPSWSRTLAHKQNTLFFCCYFLVQIGRCWERVQKKNWIIPVFLNTASKYSYRRSKHPVWLCGTLEGASELWHTPVIKPKENIWKKNFFFFFLQWTSLSKTPQTKTYCLRNVDVPSLSDATGKSNTRWHWCSYASMLI